MRIGFIGLLWAGPLAAQSAAWTVPSPAVVDSIFARYDRTSSPGCALGVFGGGRTLYARGYGMANLNYGLAIAPSTPFYIASTSKQFAAASIALAAAQGRLTLDDPVRKHVPELPAYADAITIRHLVHHTSGLRDYLGLWGVSGRSFADEIPEDVALDLIARQLATDFPPGARWSYSNSGYFLLSVIVRRATGQSLAAFSKQYLFDPLGMTSTHWHDDNRAIVPGRAEGYQPTATGFEIVRTSFALVGDGGLYTTVEDLKRWDDNFYDNRLGDGGPALIEQLTTPGTLANGSSHGYGFGLFRREYRGQPVVDHGGSFIGYRAQLMRFPAVRFSVAVLCNDYTAAPERMAEQVADRFLEGVLAARPAPTETKGVAVAPAILDRYVGRYEVLPGTVSTVSREGEGLVVAVAGQRVPLVATSDSEFVGRPPVGTIKFRPSGQDVLLVLPGLGGEPAKRLGDPPVLSPSALHAYVGRFASDELDTWANVSVVDGALWIRTRYAAWTPMTPLWADAFGATNARFEFIRDRRGQVSGFRLSGGRMANIRFERTARPLRWSPLDRPGLTTTATPR
ncbi:MAG: beta-lactamase family protein [Gemmatimonadetes bacterium]|nr:beta-lactamase family protein [Gemmatimonadota bacterium]